ncbi:MAG: M81 family metallopeptidase [Chloroflexi bacterium]|nr:M81 family metallopeptidase [Chloroflexota bacterium]MBT6683014.1 M81 family metallopeptidase [Chloroflexota bacterium]
MTRIAAFGIHHETNSFSSRKTTHQAFQRSGLQREGVQRGSRIDEMHRGAKTVFSGYFEAADRLGFDLVPILFAATDPGGTISAEAFDRLTGDALMVLRDEGPWDGVLLNQMGAAVSEQYPDMDGEIARRTREIVGPDVPVVMTLDLHANVSQQMSDETNALVIYHTNPHMDALPRANEACDLLVRMISGEIKPKRALEMPPMVIGIMHQNTNVYPMKGIIDDLLDVQTRPGVLHASVGQGYPWSDVHEMGFATYVLHESSQDEARTLARWIARRAWDRRADFAEDVGMTPEAAVRYALEVDKAPVVLLDAGDNIGAGSSGDSTLILEQAIAQGADSYVQTLRDPEAVAACDAVGVGGHVEIQVGGKTDDLHGRPVSITGTVRVLSDGAFEDNRPLHAGWTFFDQGRCAVVDCESGQALLLVSTSIGNVSIEQYYSVGLRPEEFKIVVAKGVMSPRPAYEPIASEMILVNSPGATSADLTTFDYAHRRTPLYPFEDQAKYE